MRFRNLDVCRDKIEQVTLQISVLRTRHVHGILESIQSNPIQSFLERDVVRLGPCSKVG